MRRIIALLLCFIFVMMLSGCYDAREVDQWSYVYAIGVDKGAANLFRFTFQIATMKEEAGGGSGGMEGQGQEDQGYIAYSIDAPTLYAAVNMAQTSISRAINYMHTKSLIISEELARDGVEELINGIIRTRQIRRIMHVIVVKGEASDFVKQYNPLLTSAIAKAQVGFIEIGKETGFIPSTMFYDFNMDMKSLNRMPVAPVAALHDASHYRTGHFTQNEFRSEGGYYAGELPRRGGNVFEFLGTAVFDGDRMVGELNGDETRAMLMIRGDFERAAIAFEDPKEESMAVTMDVKPQKKPDIQVEVDGKQPTVRVKVFLEGDLKNVYGTVPYEEDELKSLLEDAFAAYIKNIMDRTIDKCQQCKVDVFGFGDVAVKKFRTIQKWEEYNWLEKFQYARITTEVEYSIRRTGTVIKVNPTRTSRGEKQ